MKAEHRKELQTNTLADHLGKMIQGAKAKPSPNSLVIWIFVLLVLAVLVGWKYFSANSLEKRSQDWTGLGEVNSSEELQAFADEHPKTVPGLVARFQRARVALQQSLERLYADGAREQALKELKEAEETYAELANDKEARDKPLLVQEALMGVAKAREGRGDLDGALEAYEKLDKDYAKSALGQSAAEHIKQLKENPEVRKLYAKLNELASKPRVTGGTSNVLPDWLR